MENNTNTNKYICYDCGREFFSEEEPMMYNDEPVCPDCAEENYVFCAHCGETMHIDEANYVEAADGYYCDSCLNGLFTQCDDCGEYHRNWRMHCAVNDAGDYVTICGDCYHDHWVYCEQCGCLLNTEEDEVEYMDGDAYCSSCYDDVERRNNEGELHNYSYKPAPLFQRRKGENAVTSLTFGLEVEMDDGSYKGRTIREMTDAANGIAYCKYDGSLDDGIELVTHPCTLDFHRYEMHWANICRIARTNGWRSHDTDTCGMHIHVGKAQLGASYAEQRENAAKLAWMMDALWTPMVSFSRRTEDGLRWCRKNNVANVPDVVGNSITKAFWTTRNHEERYKAINLENDDTVEFRIFRGSLKRDTIIAAIELVNNFCKYAMTHTLEECKSPDWKEVAQYERFKELDTYLAERGLLA